MVRRGVQLLRAYRPSSKKNVTAGIEKVAGVQKHLQSSPLPLLDTRKVVQFECLEAGCYKPPVQQALLLLRQPNRTTLAEPVQSNV